MGSDSALAVSMPGSMKPVCRSCRRARRAARVDRFTIAVTGRRHRFSSPRAIAVPVRSSSTKVCGTETPTSAELLWPDNQSNTNQSNTNHSDAIDMPKLHFKLPDGSAREVTVERVLNGGYAGRNTDEVRHHIEELARIGVPGPGTVPTLYPLPSLLAVQSDHIQAPHEKTSGEAEWALIVGDDPRDESQWLVTAACDHTDRALEVHGVAWSKQTAPDLLGDLAWPWDSVRTRFDDFTLKAWVTHGNGDAQLLQDGRVGQLLSPQYWVDRLAQAGELVPRTMIMSGTIPMIEGVDPFADRWRVELADDRGNVSRVDYRIERLPSAWQ